MSDVPSLRKTPIAGLYVIDLIVHEDNRGWFKENYQAETMKELGLPGFEIKQNNFSFNSRVGVTRGLHAEPWDKYVSLTNGRAFCAWVDLRKGNDFGKTFVLEISPSTAVFIPRGVANGYQALEDNTVYTYLVNDVWSKDSEYVYVSLFDPELKINWPIDLGSSLVSDKDKLSPKLSEVSPLEFE